MRTIFVVDDDNDMRDSIALTLKNVGYNVQSFSNAKDCLKELESVQPDGVVVDLMLPAMTGLRFCKELREHTSVSFVMISGHGDVQTAVQSMKMGAVDFLEKPFSREGLLNAVQNAVEKTTFRRREMAEENQAASNLNDLTSREREVFDVLCEGLVTKQIAVRLGISSKTVDVHRSNISQKLGIESPTQLAHLIFLSKRGESRRETAWS